MKAPKPCIRTGCERPKWSNKHTCRWHWLLTQPPEVQVTAAAERHLAAPAEQRARVPQREWPDGERWCAGCQSFVPLFYTTGSRCKACASKASHGTRLKGTYGITEDDYQALLRWQGGRCFVCQRESRSKRLAVDHDHLTGEVRGLLCPDDLRGCNKALVGTLEANRSREEAIAMAQRIVNYLQDPPFSRLRRGETAPVVRQDSAQELWRASFGGPPVSQDSSERSEPLRTCTDFDHPASPHACSHAAR